MWMGGFFPLVSALSPLGWRSWHRDAAVRRRDGAPSSLPSTCVLSNFLILANILLPGIGCETDIKFLCSFFSDELNIEL